MSMAVKAATVCPQLLVSDLLYYRMHEARQPQREAAGQK